MWLFGENWNIQNVSLLVDFLLGFFLTLFKKIITTADTQSYRGLLLKELVT